VVADVAGDGLWRWWEGVGLWESGGRVVGEWWCCVSRRIDGDEQPVGLGARAGLGLVRIPRRERGVVDGI
jgi:hypothetical protein